jgi:hypothetical protein
LKESLTNQAQLHSKRMLWFLVIGSPVFAAGALILLMVRPAEWLVEGGCLLFCGASAILSLRMLAAARRLQAEGLRR